MLLICSQLEADDRSTSVLPSPLKELQKATPVSTNSVSNVTSLTDTGTAVSNVGQYMSFVSA